MQAGTLRHRVTIKKRASGVDRLGQKDGDWKALRTVWASVQPMGGNELERARALVPQASMKIIMRYNDDLDELCILEFKGRTFNVGNVNNMDERKIQLTAICSEARDA